MNVQSIKSKRGRDILLTANHQLEQIYYEQRSPCLALHISRNYHLLQEQCENIDDQNQWKDKAKLWWKLYWMDGASKGLGLFYDKKGFFNAS